MVVLNHASVHRRARVLQAARPELRQADMALGFLPPCSPARNAIEPVFPRVKPEEIPTRSYDTDRRLIQDLHTAFRRLR